MDVRRECGDREDSWVEVLRRRDVGLREKGESCVGEDSDFVAKAKQ